MVQLALPSLLLGELATVEVGFEGVALADEPSALSARVGLLKLVSPAAAGVLNEPG